VIVELREWSRISDDLQQERNRLANRVREQLWRYYPQMLKLPHDVADEWFLDLWSQAPTPAKAARMRESTIERILKAHRIRRWQASEVARILKQQPLSVAPGVTEAASAHIRAVASRIKAVNQQLKTAHRRLDPALWPARSARGEPAGAALRAARRGDPALYARARKDQPRRAARGGLAAPAPTRLSRVALLVRGCPGDPAQR